jgi:hypothetical protein
MTFNEAQVIREKQLCGYAYPSATIREAIEIIRRAVPEKKTKRTVGRPETGQKPRATTGKPAGRPTGRKPRPSRVGEAARRKERLAALALL